MMYYPKINGIYKRYQEGPDRGKFVIGEFAQREFELLLNVPWYWTYKWNGTSAGIHFHQDDAPEFFGRTKNSSMTFPMIEALEHWETSSDFHGSGLTVYGELVGPKIQGNPHQLEEVIFQPFDVAYQGRFWNKGRVYIELSDSGRPIIAPLRDMIDKFASGHRPYNEYVEGLVGTPDLCDLKGDRITTKLKWVDF